jgi:signal recognition particle subunit SRP72
MQTYKLEKFDRAAQIYEELTASPDASAEENDLRINRAAIDAQLVWSGLGHLARSDKPQREDLEAFESAFNAACASIARGELGQGEVLLKRAKRESAHSFCRQAANVVAELCYASEDLSDDQKATDVVSITAQQVFVLIRQGRQEEAAKICDNIPLDQ